MELENQAAGQRHRPSINRSRGECNLSIDQSMARGHRRPKYTLFRFQRLCLSDRVNLSAYDCSVDPEVVAMINLSTGFIFYWFPISVGLVGAAASVLHGWSAPAVVKASARPSKASEQPAAFPKAMAVLALAAKVGNVLELASTADGVERPGTTELAALSEANEIYPAVNAKMNAIT